MFSLLKVYVQNHHTCRCLHAYRRCRRGIYWGGWSLPNNICKGGRLQAYFFQNITMRAWPQSTSIQSAPTILGSDYLNYLCAWFLVSNPRLCNVSTHVASLGYVIYAWWKSSEVNSVGNMHQCFILVLASALVAAPSLALFSCSDDRCFRLSRDANKIPFSDLSVAALTGRCHTECALVVHSYIT